ncbi:MAG: hypothetical protein ACKO2P_12480 [Planctomycetota bacterium]
MTDSTAAFHQSLVWQPQPAAAAWIARQTSRFLERQPVAAEFSRLLLQRTGTRLIDWIDHLHTDDPAGIEDAGYVCAADGWWVHPGALLPPVLPATHPRMLLRVDRVADFAAANGWRFPVQTVGEPGDLLRMAFVEATEKAEFGVIERRGCNIRQPGIPLTDSERVRAEKIHERLLLRPRRFADHDEAFSSLQLLLEEAAAAIGRDLACDLFFAAERQYWQLRNSAAQMQFMRQNSLGLGWGNHDHHTYRSSRVCFSRLIGLFESLGFVCRERFYPGHGAGWGAQVLEHPVCPIVIFADVDLTEQELAGDFAHQPLAPSSRLGTIGLWCGLHGEALFEAGMHHLECQFDFDAARAQLAALGTASMKPFTDFSFLRQCFTEAERWPVSAERLEQLSAAGLLTADQAREFAHNGALGSHLEILERNDGYRGFNQTGITEIIQRTDPRSSLKSGPA